MLIAVGLSFLYLHLQSPVDYPLAPLFDGNQYLKIYTYMVGETEGFDVIFPYNTRVLVPAMATLIPVQDPIKAFLILNFLFMIMSLVVLYFLWAHLEISPFLMSIGFLWLILHWTGIIRLNIFDPVTVDLPLYLFQGLLVLIIFKRQLPWLILLSPLATAQKESFMALLVVFILYALYRRDLYGGRDLLWIGAALVFSILTKLVLNQIYSPSEPGYSSFRTLAFHLKLVVEDPFRLVRWLTAIFVAYGGFLILNIQSAWKRSELREQGLLLVFSVTYFLFGILAGGDMLRIVFLGFPFVMTLFLKRLGSEASNLVIISMVLSVPLMKLRGMIPDPVSSWDEFAEWYPEYASWQMVMVWFGYGLVVFVATLLWRRYQPRASQSTSQRSSEE